MSGSPSGIVTTTAGSVATVYTTPILPDSMRQYYELRWRVLWMELHHIAREMGWADRLPSNRN